jgi:hypothetical protein
MSLGYNKILIKRNSNTNSIPLLSSIDVGELSLNTADGKIFTKTVNGSLTSIVSFLNDNDYPYTLNHYYSSVNFKYGNNTVNQVFASVLNGYNNDITGGGSSVINGEDNDIAGDFSLIGSGLKNKITANGDYSFIAAGSSNLISHTNSFILGSGLSSHSANFTYVNNLSSQGNIYGQFQINASDITSGTLGAARLPVFNGDITTTVSNTGSVSAKVVAIQGSPISTQSPVNGQTLQWTGTAWTPGAIPNGGSGGGGLVYYLNYANAAQTPTTNLPATPNTPKELGITGVVGGSSYTLTNVSTTNYDLICGFVSLTASPQTTVIPAGLWDFNIWADSTATTKDQMILKLDVYKYDGSNVPTLLASSGDIYLYDPNTPSQYIASVVFPQTTLLTTDRIYIELRAKGTQSNKNVTIYFGGTSPTHVHTTFPSVGGSGLLKVIDGVYQTPASLLVNTDVAANAAIDQSKINGLTDVASKANSVYTTVQSNSSSVWNYQGTDIKALTGDWINGNLAYTTIQSNSAAWNLDNSTDTEVRSLTSNWENTYTNVQTNSSTWNYQGTDIKALTGDWNSTYNTVLANSSVNWNYQGTDIKALTGDWNSTYNTVLANSSVNWNYQGTDIKALTGDWINGNLAYTTIQSNSAAWNLDNSTDTEVRSLTSNWNSTYSTLSSLSSIWDNTTSTVQSQSATWGTSSNTTLISAVTSDVEVGGIEIAQIVPQNTSFQQFVETLLTKIYYPTITAPSATMSSSIGTNVEAGTEGITLTVNLNRGAITGKTVASIWDPNTLQDYRSGTATQYIILGVNNGTTSAYTSATAIIQEGTNTFNGSVTYATGPQPVDSKGQNYLSPLASNTIAVSTPVYGRRKAFYGVDNTAANSSDIRSLAGSLLNPSNGSTFTISIPIGTVNVVFAYPSSLRNVNSVLYQEGFDADVKANFTQTTVSVEGANGYSATNYKVYKYTPVAAFTQAATYNVTI